MPMPAMPATVMLPNDRSDGYYPANVVAAIPLRHGNLYAVTAIKPTSSPDAPVFIAATAGRSIHGFWVAEDTCDDSTVLASALVRMTNLAGLY